MAPPGARRVRLAEVLAALSVVTDLGTGQAPGKALRAAVVATRLAEHLGFSRPVAHDAYYAALLRHLGCTATAHDEAFFFGGDELAWRPLGERSDFADPREMLGLLAAIGRGTGSMRPRYVLRTLRLGDRADQLIVGAVCEAGRLLAAQLGMSREVQDGVDQVFERWDGRGAPGRLRGDAIVITARLAAVAHQAVIFHRLGGPAAADDMVRRRKGRWLDPGVADAYLAIGSAVLRELDAADAWQLALDVEPEPRQQVGESRLDSVARAFADLVDLQTVATLGHSPGVAALADGAARSLRLDDGATVRLRRAALLHDLGRVGISVAVWERTSGLTQADHEQVRLHPYLTARVLERSEILAPLAPIASQHHERLDGSGYHVGLRARELSIEARILAAADVVQALCQPRPHRPARSLDEAAHVARAEATGGRLDADAVGAVLEAAGVAPRRLVRHRPAGLSEREVEVLRLIARGLSNRAIGEQLGVSPRTAEHHVQHVYDKIGLATRAGAALFALEHDLLSD